MRRVFDLTVCLFPLICSAAIYLYVWICHIISNKEDIMQWISNKNCYIIRQEKYL